MNSLLALDLSTSASGWAVFDKETRKPTRGGVLYNPDYPLNTYKQKLKDKVYRLITESNVDEIAVENCFSGINHKTNESLFIINNSINELRQEENLALSVFHWENTVWKKGLIKMAGTKIKYKAMSKDTVALCLRELGYNLDKLPSYISGDFVDALGIGHFHLHKSEIDYKAKKLDKSSIYEISKPKPTSFRYIAVHEDDVLGIESQLPEIFHIKHHMYKKTLEKSILDFFVENNLQAIPCFHVGSYTKLGADVARYSFEGDLLQEENLCIIAIHNKLKVRVEV